MPIISFIVPFRAPETTPRWESVSQYLALTVDNLLCQTHQDIEVHIVGNDPPACTLNQDPRVYFHSADEPIPNPLTWQNLNRDRRRKIALGCMAAVQSEPKYIMPVDADDRVHPRLAAFLAESPVYPAWVLRHGLVVHAGLKRFYRCSNYSDLTGSSCILSLEETGIPSDTSFGEFEKCYWFLGNHKIFVSDLRKRGKNPQPIPFEAGAYILGHGENLSNELRNNPIQRLRFWLRYILLGRKISDSFHETYGQL